MKALSTVFCAICAAFGLTISASAETETIAYWPFGTNGFHDVSGNGHDLVGTNVEASDAAYMILNQGSTTNQYLKTATALDLSGETAVTFECWFRQTPAKPAKVTCLLMSSANPNTGTGGFLITNNGRIQAQYRAVEGGWQLDYSDEHPSAWNDGMWHHVGYVVERSRTDHFSCRLYVDGVRQTGGGSNPVIAALFNDVFMIGGGSTTYEAGNNYFRGYIDDVRISRGVVAPADFLKYPTVGKTMRADDGKLPVVAYWPFGGKHDRDATGNGFDLTMDDTVPMLSGTPKLDWGERGVFTNFYLASFPMSAFSKTGVTIECFVKSGSGSTSAGNILMLSPTTQYYNNAGAFRFSYEANFKTAGITFRLPTSGKYANSLTTEEGFGALNDNRWRHFAFVYDPSKTGAGIVTFYVDGVAAPCSSDVADQGAFALPDTKLYFSRVANGTGAFYGQFDDVRITAGVLTPDQFLASRSVGSTVALYRFDQSSLADVSGNGTELVLMSGSGTASGSPTFGDGGYPESGTGLVMSGKNDGKDWIQTENPIDFTNTKGLTVEYDFNGPQPKAEDNSTVYVMAASSNATTEKGGFVIYRTGDGLQGQFRKDASSWWMPLVYAQTLGTTLNGYHRGRYVIDATTAGKITTSLWADGTRKDGTPQNDSFTSLGNLTLCFGHCPSYYGSSSSEPCYLKGKYLHIAVSDVLLDSADFVLDNLIDPTEKQTLAYWDFASFGGLSVADAPRRGGGLVLDGSTTVTTTNLTLSALTQVTVECFVRFGGIPSSGSILSLGSGVGSFAVVSDATADTLTGSFIPYDHLAASNGGTTELAPLAGKAWHHVALVIDRTKSGADAVRFYVDYQRAMPAGRAWDKSATILDGEITIGDGFTGRIDDLRVSAGALEPSEFIQISECTRVPDGTTISVR